MAATRFPNKPLAKINGVPMIGHIYARTVAEPIFDEVYVATCDKEIFDYVKSVGGKVVMTADTHERCTDRTAEALLKIEEIHDAKFDVVGMVQGDEPLVVPQVFKEAIQALRDDSSLPLVNIMGKIENDEEFNSPNTVKVVIDRWRNALYFSREPIPSAKKYSQDYPKYKQTGMIFFRRDALIEFNSMQPTMLEKIESVDMMRIVEQGGKIKMILTTHACYGVDIPSDIQKVEKVMTNDALFKAYRSKFGI
ncbi:3-deoxy-manno-octulosonate cytidylyltransferase [Bdellovibrio bacteriovorus]|uniref:3-deoxy-manno-octulosonate cytidylyltransferase n=2 Tax=Bdellovibrio bacteriovorus TaxID=959 RepID=A0A150WME5_BDEBC|nr:3-deoxy-manno-octulosonate cytidylyltransferase [Bdellovibrio bacteriovorus]